MKITFKIFLQFLISVLIFFKLSGQENTIQLRILSFNIYHGATMNNDFDLIKIAKVIKSVNPDLVALQEVDYRTNRVKKIDLLNELAKLTNLIPLFGRAMYYDGGEYGVGILSKYTFIKSQLHLLPFSKNHEPRAALEIMFELTSGDTIVFISTHLDHTKNTSDRINQIKKINRLFSKNDLPCILAGDMNATPESNEIKLLKTLWTSANSNEKAKTFPSKQAIKKIDYIFFKPANKWEVIKNQIICDKIASDHCAVLSVLNYIPN